MEADAAFSTAEHPLYKFNPLSNWTSEQVWRYIRENDVPYNELHNRGYISIGCEPCTRAVLPNQYERVGRWWWEETIMKEWACTQEIRAMAENDACHIRKKAHYRRQSRLEAAAGILDSHPDLDNI